MRAFVSLGSRTPPTLAAEHLADLVRLTSEAYPERPQWTFSVTDPDDEPEGSPVTCDFVVERDASPFAETEVEPSNVVVAEVERSPLTNVMVIDSPQDENRTEDSAASSGLAEHVGSSNGHLAPVAAGDLPGARSQELEDTVTVTNGRASPVMSQSVSLHRSASAPRAEPTVDGSEIPECPSLIQIQCFGDFRVRSGERELNPLAEEKASYRAWEVLAFLAAHPAGPVSKEKLFVALWPESDEEAAANSLRQALFRLRAVLSRQIPGVSSDVVRNERGGTCRLDPKQVSSDVQEFLALCDQAPRLPPQEGRKAWERALALYRGDLFDGRGTRTYAWVDERDGSGTTLREQYREQYLLATQRLARLYGRMGQPGLAVPLLKRLLKAEPTLEDVVRDLYRCYRQLEDLGSLIREDRHLRQALREGLYDPNGPDDDPAQYEPEEATIDLYNETRAELEARSMQSGGARTVAVSREKSARTT
jgi:DNA-binding SARP family transcriptional activator